MGCANANFNQIPDFLYPDVKILDLHGNNISSITKQSLRQYHSLQKLDLSENNVMFLAPDCFEGQGELFELNLNNNLLKDASLLALGSAQALGVLHLRNNAINSLDHKSFSRNQRLKILDLSRNDIQRIPQTLFDALPVMENLDLSQNRLTSLAGNLFSGVPFLKSLSLRQNEIGYIEGSVFAPIQNLRSLDLRDNQLGHLESSHFQYLEELRTLNLDGNPITELLPNVFTSLKNIQLLSLNRTSLSEIPNNLFSANSGLRSLQLCHVSNLSQIGATAFGGAEELQNLLICHNPKLYEIEDRTLESLRLLENLDLSHNNITTLNSTLVKNLKMLKRVSVEGNPWTCDCKTRWIKKLLSYGEANSRNFPKLIGQQNTMCTLPATLSGKNFGSLTKFNFTCGAAEIVSIHKAAYFPIGAHAVLDCHVMGTPLPLIVWTTPRLKKLVYMHNESTTYKHNESYHDDHHWHGSVEYIPLAKLEDGRIKLLENGSLYIDYVMRSDAGPYTCYAENQRGNSSAVIRFRLNYAVLFNVRDFSFLVGFASALGFFLLGMVFVVIRCIVHRCQHKERKQRKTIREILSNLDTYKTHQFDKLHTLRDSYNIQLVKLKDHCFSQLECLRDNYQMQLGRIRETCVQRVEKVREGYSHQMCRFKDYGTHQMDKVTKARDNYHKQVGKIREYGTGQLERLREQYKLQQQHIIKILEVMNLENCRGIVEGECLRTESMLFDPEILGIDLTPTVLTRGQSVSDASDYITATSNSSSDLSSNFSNSLPELVPVILVPDPNITRSDVTTIDVSNGDRESDGDEVKERPRENIPPRHSHSRSRKSHRPVNLELAANIAAHELKSAESYDKGLEGDTDSPPPEVVIEDSTKRSQETPPSDETSV